MSEILSGMIPNWHVSEVLSELWHSLPRFSAGVIRSLDSTHDSEGISKILKLQGFAFDRVYGNVVVTRDVLKEMPAAGLFSGFDEVWLLEPDTPSCNLDEALSATSESTDFSKALPPGLAAAMEAVRCCLVLGDGCGLNYATTDERMAGELARL